MLVGGLIKLFPQGIIRGFFIVLWCKERFSIINEYIGLLLQQIVQADQVWIDIVEDVMRVV